LRVSLRHWFFTPQEDELNRLKKQFENTSTGCKNGTIFQE